MRSVNKLDRTVGTNRVELVISYITICGTFEFFSQPNNTFLFYFDLF